LACEKRADISHGVVTGPHFDLSAHLDQWNATRGSSLRIYSVSQGPEKCLTGCLKSVAVEVLQQQCQILSPWWISSGLAAKSLVRPRRIAPSLQSLFSYKKGLGDRYFILALLWQSYWVELSFGVPSARFARFIGGRLIVLEADHGEVPGIGFEAVAWAAEIVTDREIDSATLEVTRDGVGIKSLPMARLPMGEAANARRA
jgi:hypothetical protein